jgi:hypothetical protein
METLYEWKSIARLMIQIPPTCYKSDKSDKRKPSLPTNPPPPTKLMLAKDWKSTSLARFYIGRVYGSEQSDSPPPKPDPFRPHKFPLTIIRHRGRETDRTNFTHLQELWNGREKPLDIQTAGHRERNLTTQIK